MLRELAAVRNPIYAEAHLRVSSASTPHDQLFWEFRQQTAVRRGPWKLTLRPYESDDNLSEHEVFLADLSTDIGETVNLRHVHPELTEELTAAALAWRSDVAPYYEEQDW